MRGFLLVWAGQIVSVLASGMSGFALTLFMYERTGSATAMGLMGLCYTLPFLLMSPLAGALVDRYDRKLMMAISDLVGAVGTAGILVFSLLGRLEVWQLYVAGALMGIGNTFQWPAYSASISLMVPEKDLARANGLMGLVESGPAVFAPILAGIALPVLGLPGLLALDLATFALALGGLSLVTVPNPPKADEASRPSLLSDATFGFRYILERRGLFSLQLAFLFVNLFSSTALTLVSPFVLAKTGSDSVSLGSVQSAAAIGGLAGGLLMSVWGGFSRRRHGIFLGCFLIGLFGSVFFGLSRSLPYWIAFSALGSAAGPLANASSQAIWQARVPPEIQGRVFSARRLISWLTTPIAPLLAGLLADFFFEPLMRGADSPSLPRALVGSGPGAGMGFLMALCGLGVCAAALAVELSPDIRDLDRPPKVDPESQAAV